MFLSKKEGNLKSIVFLVVIIVLLSITVFAFNSGELVDSITGLVIGFSGDTEIKLAQVYNQDNLDYDEEYAEKYLLLRNNFSNLDFKEISGDKEDFTFTMGNKRDNLKGIKLNDNNFAIDLVLCDEFESFCHFRINGVPTDRMYVPEKIIEGRSNTFDIDGTYIIKLISGKFNQCDNHRFCHLGYEGYHELEVSVERK